MDTRAEHFQTLSAADISNPPASVEGLGGGRVRAWIELDGKFIFFPSDRRRTLGDVMTTPSARDTKRAYLTGLKGAMPCDAPSIPVVLTR